MQKLLLFSLLIGTSASPIFGAACFTRRLAQVAYPAIGVRTYASNDELMKRLEELHQRIDNIEEINKDTNMRVRAALNLVSGIATTGLIDINDETVAGAILRMQRLFTNVDVHKRREQMIARCREGNVLNGEKYTQILKEAAKDFEITLLNNARMDQQKDEKISNARVQEIEEDSYQKFIQGICKEMNDQR